MKIRVLDFSEYPGLRHSKISEKSGEDFYHEVLNSAFSDAYSTGKRIEIDLDGVDSYAPSFLDEAFGNLVYDFGEKNVEHLLTITSNEEPHWIQEIKGPTFKKWELRRKSKLEPKVTKVHEPWNRLVNGQIEVKVWMQPENDDY